MLVRTRLNQPDSAKMRLTSFSGDEAVEGGLLADASGKPLEGWRDVVIVLSAKMAADGIERISLLIETVEVIIKPFLHLDVILQDVLVRIWGPVIVFPIIVTVVI